MQVSILFTNLDACSYNLPCNRDNLKTNNVVELRKCFFLGGNSTLRQHCRKHYEIYKQKCEAANIPMNHYAIPPKIAQALARSERERSQTTLDDIVFNRPEAPDTAFTRDGILHTVAQFVACDDQVSELHSITAYTHLGNKAFAVASNKLFRNCLVSMRPKTKLSELPSSHDIGVYIHNKCAKWLTQLQKDITVSKSS